MTLLAMLITSPHTHIQDYIIATCAGVWIWMSAHTYFASRSGKVLKALIVSFPAASWMYYFLLGPFNFLKIQPFFVWALAVAGILANCMRTSWLAKKSQQVSK